MTKRQRAELVASKIEVLARSKTTTGNYIVYIDELDHKTVDYLLDHEEAVMARLNLKDSVRNAKISDDYKTIGIEFYKEYCPEISECFFTENE